MVKAANIPIAPGKHIFHTRDQAPTPALSLWQVLPCLKKKKTPQPNSAAL
jgi:hypothetical protein